ncbi:MAG: hypothetical protein IJ003_01825 [Candidatus Gastranaerophilales bacterium]|nr:hypothetical protein [Candidatus Gastranaerophilales bacterium]
MIKEIIDNDIAYAKIIRATYKPSDKTEFFTRESDEVQFGVVNYEKNYKTGAHYHNHLKRKTTQTDEILMVQSGSARVDFYNDKGSYIKSCEIFQGDIIIIYKGGHNIFFYDDTKVFMIKPGSYKTNEDSTRIVGANNYELSIDID